MVGEPAPAVGSDDGKGTLPAVPTLKPGKTEASMGNIFLYSLVAAANATLLAAVTVMLFLPNPKRLLIGSCWAACSSASRSAS